MTTAPDTPGMYLCVAGYVHDGPSTFDHGLIALGETKVGPFRPAGVSGVWLYRQEAVVIVLAAFAQTAFSYGTPPASDHIDAIMRSVIAAHLPVAEVEPLPTNRHIQIEWQTTAMDADTVAADALDRFASALGDDGAVADAVEQAIAVIEGAEHGEGEGYHLVSVALSTYEAVSSDGGSTNISRGLAAEYGIVKLAVIPANALRQTPDKTTLVVGAAIAADGNTPHTESLDLLLTFLNRCIAADELPDDLRPDGRYPAGAQWLSPQENIELGEAISDHLVTFCRTRNLV